MILAEVTDRTGFTFPVFIDDEELTDLQRVALEDDGAPSPDEAAAMRAADFFGPDASVRVLDSDFDQHGITGSTPEGNALPDGTFGAQVFTETWEAFEQWGGSNGYLFFVRSLDKDRIVQAGVDAGYNEVAAEVAAKNAALDHDDLARIANALNYTQRSAYHQASKQHDEDLAAIIRGVAGSMNATIEKVERLLDR